MQALSRKLARGDPEIDTALPIVGDQRGLVGRERELRELCAGLDQAIAGHGQLFLIAGEPGIGKTRLLMELAHLAESDGARVLRGSSSEALGVPPYRPWTQVLRACLAGRPLDPSFAPIRRLVAHGSEREPTPGGRRPLAPGSGLEDSEEARFRLFDSVATLLREEAGGGPVVVLLDDLHWADESSLLLLGFLARELRDARMLFVGAYRDVEARLSAGAGRRIADLASEARTIRLGGLDGSAVALLVERVAGRRPASEVVAAVVRATDGNPLFVEEIARTLDAEERIEGDPPAGIPLPERVRALIGRRMKLVSGACRRMLGVASVLGREAERALLERVCDSTVEDSLDLLSAIEEASAARILVASETSVSFVHDLFRETLYEELGLRERARLHGEIAAAIEATRGPELEPWAAELASHFLCAGPERAEQAVRYSLLAAERAAAAFAHVEASQHYQRALQALSSADRPDPTLRCRILLGLGESSWSAGEFEAARRSYQEAASLAESRSLSDELARAAIGYGGPDVSFDGGTVEPRLIGLLERALARIDTGDGALRASLMARLAAALTFSDQRARGDALARDAVAMARRVGDKPTLHFTLHCLVSATWGPDNLEERLSICREATRLAVQAGGAGAGELHAAIMTSLLESGDPLAAEREAESYRRRTAVAGRRISTWVLAVRRTTMALLEGRFAEVEALATHALQLGSERQSRNAVQYFGAQLLVLRREHGRLAEIVADVEGFVKEYPAVPAWRAALAWIYVELERDEDARRELERLASDDFAHLPKDMFWILCLWLLADVVARLDDVRRAERLYELLLPFAGRCVVSGSAFCGGSVERSLGLLASTLRRYDAAGTHFEASIALHSRIGARPWLAYDHHDVARMLLMRAGPGDTAEAQQRLTEAEESARALGMASLLARVEHLRAHTPASPGEASEEAILRQEGEYWTLAYRGQSARLRDARGLRLISLLLGSPGRDFRATELAAWPAPPPGPSDAKGLADEAGLRVGVDRSDASGADARALAEYRARLEQLREEADEAERFNDSHRAARAREEIELLAGELVASTRRGGRRLAADAERARLSVTKAIRYAIGKVERVHPLLGDLLAGTVKTGTSCRYEPDPRLPVRWIL